MSQDIDELQLLLEKIYCERGFDFRGYRESTLTRRLGRRLRARGVHTYGDYARVLGQDPAEYEKLFDDLTINVSSFFRDEAAFKALAEKVFPGFIDGDQATRKELRVWSAGCATGQEPYSIAMILAEMLGSELSPGDVTVLGTDIDAKSLQRARDGVFGTKEVEGIRPAWIEKYFDCLNGSFRIKRTLTQLVTFDIHNLVNDPPFDNLDLVVCRNVLIYFNPDLLAQVLGRFHEALKEDGYLLLGKAEVPTGETKSLFQCVDIKAKLYRKARQPRKKGRRK